MQKQYQERTTLHTWPWNTWERDAEWSSPTIACHIHDASVPFGRAVAQRYDVPWDWLWDACHMAGVRSGTCCERFCSKEGPHYCFELNTRNPTINIIHEFGNPLGIPYQSCTAQLSGAYVTQESVSLRILVSKKGMICAPYGCSHQKPLAKGGKGKITCSESTNRFPQASCFKKSTCSVPEIWGCMYNLVAWSVKGTRNGTRYWIPMQPRKAQRN
jgi:hypothetical protein